MKLTPYRSVLGINLDLMGLTYLFAPLVLTDYSWHQYGTPTLWGGFLMSVALIGFDFAAAIVIAFWGMIDAGGASARYPWIRAFLLTAGLMLLISFPVCMLAGFIRG